MENYLMAIDAGTGSVRVILFDTKGNECFAEHSEWTHHEDYRYPGSMNFDVETNFKLIIELIQTVLKKNKIDTSSIAAISSTSMREAIVLYDADGIELWACSNVDSRSDDEVLKLNEERPELEKELYKYSGQTFSLSAIPRILWVKKNLPEIYQKAQYVTMLNDWITYKLSDIISVEPSNGCTTGLFDINKRQWGKELIKKSGIKKDIFPIVVESGTIIGNITESIAKKTGLNTKIPVVSGGGDAQLGCIGMGAIKDGDAAILGGSFWQYEYTTSTIKTDPQASTRLNCHAVPNTWQYEAIAFNPGIVMKWFKNSFCELEKYLEEETGKSVYSQMEEKALQVPPGSYGMFSIFSDKMNYINWKHAAPSFINFKLDADKFNKATFYRSIMENAAMVTRANMEQVSNITNALPEKIIFAGGASNSNLWCQILADTLGVKVIVPMVKESTALGASICAGIGANIYKSFDDAINKVVKYDQEFSPSEDDHKTYNDQFQKWKTIYQNELDLANKGLTDHMWSAPGL